MESGVYGTVLFWEILGAIWVGQNPSNCGVHLIQKYFSEPVLAVFLMPRSLPQLCQR